MSNKFRSLEVISTNKRTDCDTIISYDISLIIYLIRLFRYDKRAFCNVTSRVIIYYVDNDF